MDDAAPALLRRHQGLALPASIEYLRDPIEGVLGLPAPDRSKLLARLQEHISDLQEELLSHILKEQEAKLKEDLRVAALHIHHLEKESTLNACRCVEEKEASEQLAAHAAKLEEDLHAATLHIHHLEKECTMNARRCVEEKQASEQITAHAAKLEEDLHAATIRIHHLEMESTLNARCCVEEEEEMRDKAKLERNKRKKERPYILSQGATLPREMEKKVVEKVQSIRSDLKIYVKEMTKTCIDDRMKFCRDFAKQLPSGRANFSLELEGEAQAWPTRLNREGRTGYIHNGWIEFVRYNKLKEGDVCLFQLKERCGHVLTVYLIRRPESEL